MQTDSCSKCSSNVVLDLLGLVACRSCGAWNHGEHIPCVWCVGFVVYVGDVPESIALGVRVCVVFAIVLGFYGAGGLSSKLLSHDPLLVLHHACLNMCMLLHGMLVCLKAW